MSTIAEALQTFHEELKRIARDAEELSDSLGKSAKDRGALRDLLQREFRPDLSRPGAQLWLETVIDDIARMVASEVRELADAIHSAAFAVDLEEPARARERRRRFHCIDCSADTITLGETYMVKREVWDSVCESDGGMLCVGCLERRLGRRLGPDDFTEAPCNDPDTSSLRLRARMLGIEEASAA